MNRCGASRKRHLLEASCTFGTQIQESGLPPLFRSFRGSFINPNRFNPTDSIRQSDLESLLADTFLQSVKHFAEIDSTNTRAIELLATGDGVATPCLVYAENQSAGRGRGANQWWSAKGSLTFSVVVDFQEIGLSSEQKPLLPLLTGMAILRACRLALPDGDLSLKWPNDVFLDGRKLAGILIEVPSQSSDGAVVGVGLNVNNRFADAPQELQSTGIAMAAHWAMEHPRIEILRSFLQCFEELAKSLSAGQSFLDDWPKYCLLTGKEVTLQAGATQVTGVCRGVDESGALLLQVGAEQQRFFGGVIQAWR